jgi:hypothetical protein
MNIKDLFLYLTMLGVLMGYYLVNILPNQEPEVPKSIQKIINGETPLIELFQKPELLKELKHSLGKTTPVGVRFKTLSRQFNPYKGTENKIPPYYTLNDWALGNLEFLPIKNLPFIPDLEWTNDVQKLMYQNPQKAIYGKEKKSAIDNRQLIALWQKILTKYIKD